VVQCKAARAPNLEQKQAPTDGQVNRKVLRYPHPVVQVHGRGPAHEGEGREKGPGEGPPDEEGFGEGEGGESTFEYIAAMKNTRRVTRRWQLALFLYRNPSLQVYRKKRSPLVGVQEEDISAAEAWNKTYMPGYTWTKEKYEEGSKRFNELEFVTKMNKDAKEAWDRLTPQARKVFLDTQTRVSEGFSKVQGFVKDADGNWIGEGDLKDGKIPWSQLAIPTELPEVPDALKPAVAAAQPYLDAARPYVDAAREQVPEWNDFAPEWMPPPPTLGDVGAFGNQISGQVDSMFGGGASTAGAPSAEAPAAAPASAGEGQ